jgi:UDP-N-acetylmuramate--alanine ligase
MSGIAELLLSLGYTVSGSDLKETTVTRRLRDLGGRIRIGHSPTNIEGADVVVVSTAIPDTNCEVLKARTSRIPVIPRAEMLAELMRLKRGIAISGSHGKTTTTSMISSVLMYAQLDPTIVIGGKFNNIASNAKLGNGNLLVCEADESDGSLLKLSPIMAVVTNIDLEHMDYYKNLREIKQAFLSFIDSVPFFGCAIVCVDDPNVRDITKRAKRRILTYGLRKDADLRAYNIETSQTSSEFDVMYKGKGLGRIKISPPGVHYVRNSLAAIGVGFEVDIEFDVIREGLRHYNGVERRFQVKGKMKNRDVFVIDDYAHHPTEIRATLQGASVAFPGRRIIAVFQPHRYTRTKAVGGLFGEAFGSASEVIVTPIYAAGEEKIPGVSSRIIINSLREAGIHTLSAASFHRIVRLLMERVKDGDLVLILGAGDIWKVADMLLEE